MASHVTVQWIDGGHKSRFPPKPSVPDGLHLDMSMPGRPFCEVQFDYPAKRCGIYVVECSICSLRIAVTTAGRADDPRSLKLPCATLGAKQ